MEPKQVVWYDASCAVSASTELGLVPCPVCHGTGRLTMALPVADADSCPACWAAGEVASDVAPYLVRRQIPATPLRLALRRTAS